MPWRRAKEAAPQADQATDENGEQAAEAALARRVPTGKAGRTAKPDTATGPEEEPVSKPDPVADDVDAAAVAAVDDRADVERSDSATADAGSDPDADADGDAVAGSDPDADAGSDPDADAEQTDGGEAEPEPEPVLVAHRPAGRRLLTVAAAASVLFVASGAFAGAMLQPYLSDRAAVDTKLEIAKTAADAINTLWSYTPDDMATLPDRASRYLSGDFASEYRRYIDAIVSTNQQAQVTNTTQVMGTAVETLSPSEATAIVYTNSVSMSPVTKNVPSLRYLSYRITLERDGGDWLITGMNSITSLDLSPQL